MTAPKKGRPKGRAILERMATQEADALERKARQDAKDKEFAELLSSRSAFLRRTFLNRGSFPLLFFSLAVSKRSLLAWEAVLVNALTSPATSWIGLNKKSSFWALPACIGVEDIFPFAGELVGSIGI